MLAYPDRLWLAQREYERHGGIEHVEQIVTHSDMLPDFTKHGYEVTEYVAADSEAQKRIALLAIWLVRDRREPDKVLAYAQEISSLCRQVS